MAANECPFTLTGEVVGTGRIVSDGSVRRIHGRHLKMAALSIGVLLEKQAFEFCTRQVEVSRDVNVLEFFLELANWQEGHYRMLLREDEALKEKCWSENRFEPLL